MRWHEGLECLCNSSRLACPRAAELPCIACTPASLVRQIPVSCFVKVDCVVWTSLRRDQVVFRSLEILGPKKATSAPYEPCAALISLTA